jgi:glycosyltransferase involved in cell wall biosynthesis
MEGDQTMKVAFQNRVASHLKRSYKNRFRKDLYFSAVDDWALYWYARYLSSYLSQNSGMKVYLCNNPLKMNLKRQIIFFGARQKFLRIPFKDIHASNDVFLLWPHGDPSSMDSQLKKEFHLLPEAAGMLRGIVTLCEGGKRDLIKFGIASQKIHVIPVGVDLNRFTPVTDELRSSMRREMGIPQDAVCVGSFQKDGEGWDAGDTPKLIKGPDVFLEVVKKLSRYQKNLHVLLTGPARGYVKKGLEKIGVPYTHQMLKRDEYHKIARFYHALDLYLITSRCEGGPIMLLESWASGVPVVSTRMGMPADVVRHGENGMLADSEDIKSLHTHCMSMIEDKDLYERCRSRALQDVKDFDWSRIAKRHYEELYTPCL